MTDPAARANTVQTQQRKRRGAAAGRAHHCVCGCGTRDSRSSGRFWAAAEQVAHGQRVVGTVARRLRRLSRFTTYVHTVASRTNGVEALLAAAHTASLVVLQTQPLKHEHPLAAVGSTMTTGH